MRTHTPVLYRPRNTYGTRRRRRDWPDLNSQHPVNYRPTRPVGRDERIVVPEAVRGRYTSSMASEPHVTLSGDITGDYIVDEKGPGGELRLVPDTSISAIRQRLGTEPMTVEEFDRHFGDLPSDDEG